MNPALARAIVGCLSRSSETAQCPSTLQPFDRREWERTFSWLDLSGLAIYFWQGAKESGAQCFLPLEVRTRLERNQAENAARVTDMAEEFAALNRLWEEVGVRYAVLKGFAMVPDYCHDASLRTQYDHDYLLDPESLDIAEAALRAAGYVRKNPHEKHPIVYFRPTRAPGPPACAVDFYSRHLLRPVELHLELWEAGEERIEIAPPEGALRRTCLRTWQDIRFSALADEDALVFQVLHCFRHILRNWCRLSVFYEIACFLEQRSANLRFWERFRERVENRRWLPQAAGVVFSLASALFSVPVPPLARPFTLEAMTPAMRLWIERYGKDSALGNCQGNKYSLFLHREFVEDISAWREVRRRRLFPLARIPHAVKSSAPRHVSFLRGRRAQGIHVVRRAKFHLSALLSYAREYPGWVRRLELRKKAVSAAKPVAGDFVGSTMAVPLHEE